MEYASAERPIPFDDLNVGDRIMVRGRLPAGVRFVTWGSFEFFRYVKRWWYLAMRDDGGQRRYIRTSSIASVWRTK